MGCGILFPRDYTSSADSDDSRDSPDSDGGGDDFIDVGDFSDSDDEDEWWQPGPALASGTKVQVNLSYTNQICITQSMYLTSIKISQNIRHIMHNVLYVKDHVTLMLYIYDYPLYIG